MTGERVKQNQQALRDFALLNELRAQSNIVRQVVNANNFEITFALIPIIQQDQFRGNSTEDPNAYLANFSKICDAIKFD